VTVLIAGSSGLVGSALTKIFQDSGEEVVGINTKVVNLLDLDKLITFMHKVKPTLVIDAAAKVGGIGINDALPVEFLADNLRIQLNLMEAAYLAKVNNFIFLGSSCIYPRNSEQPIKEEYLMTGPLESSNSAYAVAKIAGLELVNSYRKEFGLNWITLMPSNLYGPNDNFNLDTSHVLPAMIRRFVEAVEENVPSVTLWGSGSPRREFLHVDDMARAVLIASKSYSSSLHLNIGSGEDLTIKELAQKVAMISGYKGEINWDHTKPDGTPRKLLDVSRIQELNWRPEISLDEGIFSTIEWYRDANKIGGIRK
jgi:GDP-L-fucose synthase